MAQPKTREVGSKSPRPGMENTVVLPRKRNSVASESGVLSEPAATDEELMTLSGWFMMVIICGTV